jgi:hypothetical protein
MNPLYRGHRRDKGSSKSPQSGKYGPGVGPDFGRMKAAPSAVATPKSVSQQPPVLARSRRQSSWIADLPPNRNPFRFRRGKSSR